MSQWNTDPGLVPPESDQPPRSGDDWRPAPDTTRLPTTPPLDATHGPPPAPPLPPRPHDASHDAPHDADASRAGPGSFPGRRRAGVAFAAAAVALGLVGGGIAIGSTIGDDDPRSAASSAPTGLAGSSSTARSTAQSSGTATTAAPPDLDEQLEPVAAAAKAIKPAVVQLETTSGLGSGFIFSEDGHILTAAHVVGASRTVNVRLGDGRTVRGTVAGTDANTDVAVVKIEPLEDMPVASLALGVPLDVGQTVLAVGSPFGLEQTVTAGIVSNVDVPVEVGPSVVPMVQTDASINQGNSGGALVDLRGRVIGINDQIASTSGDNAGIGFAIPIDVAHDVAQRIISGQPLEVGFLGVSSNEEPPDGQSGALVTQVTPGSPAQRAGLRQGDVVIEMDGQPIRGYLELVAQVRRHRPDDRVELEVRRGDDTITLQVTLGRR